MPWQNRRFETGFKETILVEKRDFVPSKDRTEMARIVGEDGAPVMWRWNIVKGVRELVTGMPNGPQEARYFPTQPDREKMAKVMPTSPPPGFKQWAWWEPSPFTEGAESRVATLCTGLVADADAKVHVGGDGLDDKDIKALLTIAGKEGAKDVKKEQPIHEVIARIRSNREAKAQKETVLAH